VWKYKLLVIFFLYGLDIWLARERGSYKRELFANWWYLNCCMVHDFIHTSLQIIDNIIFYELQKLLY
jgi:hypothetical protein